MSALGVLTRRRGALAGALSLLATLCAGPGGGAGLVAGSDAATGAVSPVAGSFYPAEPVKLEAAVRSFLKDALPQRPDRPIALVVPHAGYVYSGQIGADAYRQAIGRDYDVIVVLGTNHTLAGFERVSVFAGPEIRTPLGAVRIDRPVTDALIAADREFAYEPAAHAREHSVEVQLPFIQIAFPGVKVVAAVVGGPDPDLCSRFGKALAIALKGRRPLLVASSDLSHYPPYEDALAADRRTLGGIATMQPAALLEAISGQMSRPRPGLETSACGVAPILVAMEAARALGATSGCVIGYANSGDTALGERRSVVGYGAVEYIAGSCPVDLASLPVPGHPEPAAAAGALTETEKCALVDFARSSIRRYLETGTAPLARGLPEPLWRKQGAFVTLWKGSALRGCVGTTGADRPLCQTVGAMALHAAFADQRFDPLTREELGAVRIDVSLLGPLTRIASASELVIGRDGVSLVKGGKSALFLPEVATEQGWGLEELMDNLCSKSGMTAGCWRSGADLFAFRTEVIHEAPGG